MSDDGPGELEIGAGGAAVIGVAADVIARYGLVSLEPLLASCKTAVAREEISVAVIGRFKAGKSSFLNHYLENDILPVGVTPVTTVVTEMSYGPVEKAAVHFLDGRVEEVPLCAVREFVAETANPENQKRVARVLIELPSLSRLRGLRFVDMPGLESVLDQNTKASLDWLPNVGLAVVAVSVDPPLTQRDITLLRIIYQYTPNVSVLLTKADLVSASQLAEIIAFVRDRLAKTFGTSPDIFPYSVLAGFEEYRERLDGELTAATLSDFNRRRIDLIEHKLKNLLRECSDYLNLALASAEVVDSERAALNMQLLGEGAEVADVKQQIRLIVQSARNSARASVEAQLNPHHSVIEKRLLEELRAELPRWTGSLKFVLSSFEDWLARELAEQLGAISRSERSGLISPLDNVNRQVLRVLQSFRNQLSDRALRVFGIPLRTNEPSIEVEEPRNPDVHIGRVFDHDWELLSAFAPMSLLKGFVGRHFERRVPYMIEKNFSRLATQWQQSITNAMGDLLREAEHRLDDLADTVGRMLSKSAENAPEIRSDLKAVEALRNQLREAEASDAALQRDAT